MPLASSEAIPASTVETPIGTHLRSPEDAASSRRARGPVARLLVFSVAWAAVCAIVFLGVSDFFSAWSGQAVSVRPTASPAPKVYEVLIAGNGRSLERSWPAEIVDGLGLPFDAIAVPPVPIPAERPHTSKLRYTLHFLVEGEDGTFRRVPTTSPRALAIAWVLFVLGVGVRNMTISGSPVSLQPRGVLLPKAQAAVGAPAARVQGPPRKRPPPARRRRGPGR